MMRTMGLRAALLAAALPFLMLLLLWAGVLEGAQVNSTPSPAERTIVIREYEDAQCEIPFPTPSWLARLLPFSIASTTSFPLDQCAPDYADALLVLAESHCFPPLDMLDDDYWMDDDLADWEFMYRDDDPLNYHDLVSASEDEALGGTDGETHSADLRTTIWTQDDFWNFYYSEGPATNQDGKDNFVELCKQFPENWGCERRLRLRQQRRQRQRQRQRQLGASPNAVDGAARDSVHAIAHILDTDDGAPFHKSVLALQLFDDNMKNCATSAVNDAALVRRPTVAGDTRRNINDNINVPFCFASFFLDYCTPTASGTWMRIERGEDTTPVPAAASAAAAAAASGGEDSAEAGDANVMVLATELHEIESTRNRSARPSTTMIVGFGTLLVVASVMVALRYDSGMTYAASRHEEDGDDDNLGMELAEPLLTQWVGPRAPSQEGTAQQMA